MRRLWQSDLARSVVVTIAEPLAWLPEEKILVQGPIPGDRTLKELLLAKLTPNGGGLDAELRAFLSKTAEGLAELHYSGGTSSVRATWEEELDEVREVLGRLTETLPQLAGVADPWLEHLERLASQSPIDAEVSGPPELSPGPGAAAWGRHRIHRLRWFLQGGTSAWRGAVSRHRPGLAISVLDPGLPLEARLATVDELCDYFCARYEEHAPISHRRLALWEALDLFTNLLHSWTKIKPGRLEQALALVHHHAGRLTDGLG
jgi:hypothetical protein